MIVMRNWIASLCVVAGITSVSTAQNTVEFFGHGRAMVQNSNLNDSTSVNKNRETRGYTVFDLGISAYRSDLIKATAIMRTRNEFGGYFNNQGVNKPSTSFEFRQIKVEGTVGKIVKYEIGDIDVSLTPYTIHNFNEIYRDFESDLFAVRRNITNYEYFYTDKNTWRMQGLNAHTTLKFNKGVEKIMFRTLGNRIAAGNSINFSDMFLYGGRMFVQQSKYFQIGFNVANLSKLAGSTPNFSDIYDNQLYTSDFRGYVEFGKIGIEAKGEVGLSKYSKQIDTVSVKYDGDFYDIGLFGIYKPYNLKVGASYRSVSEYFSSPAAQSRRINDGVQGAYQSFPFLNNGVTTRNQALFDRYHQEGNPGVVYNTGINANLQNFNPIYNNITPFGAATANRQGLTLHLSTEDTNRIWRASVRYQMLEEIKGINSADKRKFTGVEGGAQVFINRAIKWKKQLSVQGGIRTENTERTVNLPVDLASTLLDAGVDVEVFTRLHIQAGYKSISAKGTEYFVSRDEFNRVSEQLPSKLSYDIVENVTATGIKYDFSNNSFFTIQAHFAEFKDKSLVFKENAYKLKQVFFLYSVNF